MHGGGGGGGGELVLIRVRACVCVCVRAYACMRRGGGRGRGACFNTLCSLQCVLFVLDDCRPISVCFVKTSTF